MVFLGDDLKTFLFGDAEAVGRYVMLGETPFLVVGVLKHKTQNSSYNSRDKDRAYIPATTFEAVFGRRYIDNIVYKIKDPRLAEAVQAQVYRVFGKRYRFDPEDKEALVLWDTTEMDKMLFFFSLGFNLFMGLIGVITLIVGGIGLANIMYVVVAGTDPGDRHPPGHRRQAASHHGPVHPGSPDHHRPVGSDGVRQSPLASSNS